MTKKNSNDAVGNLTLDLPACRALPQTTAPPIAVLSAFYLITIRASGWRNKPTYVAYFILLCLGVSVRVLPCLNVSWIRPLLLLLKLVLRV
jgi:hypothetical protein